MKVGSNKMSTIPQRAAASSANREFYENTEARTYINGAPHLKHKKLQEFHRAIIEDVYAQAAVHSSDARVLDLGSGEGTSASTFLALGALVTAVDISEEQLNNLRSRCESFSHRLEVRQEDVWDNLRQPLHYDVVIVNSFLHHVPDYLELIRLIVRRIGEHGQFVSFQDPLRYDTMGSANYAFSHFSYLAWRMCQGNLLQGLQTRIRRARGIYIAGSKEDDAEYHVTRNGVDQVAICRLLEAEGFECRLIQYFSTQGAIFQRLGSWLGFSNTFSLVARRKDIA